MSMETDPDYALGRDMTLLDAPEENQAAIDANNLQPVQLDVAAQRQFGQSDSGGDQ
jgi:hypothetical protein